MNQEIEEAFKNQEKMCGVCPHFIDKYTCCGRAEFNIKQNLHPLTDCFKAKDRIKQCKNT